MFLIKFFFCSREHTSSALDNMANGQLAEYSFQGVGQETCNTFCNIPLNVVLCVEMDWGIATNLATSLGMPSCVVK